MWGRIISTHALTEGDRLFSDVFLWINISTHALTEGDDQLFCNAEFSLISTHALTEGDTGAYANSDMRTSFQLTPSRRATRFESSIFRFPVISTHALTEGDTAPQQLQPNHSHFNSRPHGGRRSGYVSLTIPLYFNSRPHGGRPSGTRILFSCAKFQLTPSRRATGYPLILVFCQSKFQLTPSRRATVFAILIHIFTTIISTHALTEGDQQSSGAFVDLAVFQLTPSRRATENYQAK